MARETRSRSGVVAWAVEDPNRLASDVFCTEAPQPVPAGGCCDNKEGRRCVGHDPAALPARVLVNARGLGPQALERVCHTHHIIDLLEGGRSSTKP
eukprot:1137860-Prymnesium_polylepis.1